MSAKLKPFGAGGTAIDHGDLAHHVGWIEALASDEENNLPDSHRGPKVKRYEKIEDALALLNKALEAEQ